PRSRTRVWGRGAVRWDHSVCQKVAGLPSMAFVAAPFSPISSWLSTDTTRNCCCGMRLLTGVLIETVVLAAAVPPGPVQVRIWRAAGRGLTLCDPVTAVDVVEWAAHAVALAADQVTVAAWQEAICAGARLKVTLGLK